MLKTHAIAAVWHAHRAPSRALALLTLHRLVLLHWQLRLGKEAIACSSARSLVMLHFRRFQVSAGIFDCRSIRSTLVGLVASELESHCQRLHCSQRYQTAPRGCSGRGLRATGDGLSVMAKSASASGSHRVSGRVTMSASWSPLRASASCLSTMRSVVALAIHLCP